MKVAVVFFMLFIVYVLSVTYVRCWSYKSIIVWTSKEFNSTIIKSQIAKNVIIALLKTIRVNFQYGICELLIW